MVNGMERIGRVTEDGNDKTFVDVDTTGDRQDDVDWLGMSH